MTASRDDGTAGGDTRGVLVAPGDLDTASCPLPHPLVASFDFEAEVLLVSRDDGRVHVLNPSAAIVWRNLDGEISVGELASALADAFAAPLDTVVADTVTMVRQLGELGLLDGVGVTPAFEHFEPRGLLRPGEVVSQHVYFRPGGLELTVPSNRDGRRTLLVNWSSSCGFCASIAGELASCLEGLNVSGVDLVLAGRGDPELDRSLLEAYGLADRVWYAKEPTGTVGADYPFGPVGTPAAYLFDGAGRVEEAMALGAGEVPALARKAAGLEPGTLVGAALVGAPDADAAGSAARRRLRAAGGVCGPVPVGAARRPRVWAGTVALEVDGLTVGVRGDSDATVSLLRRAFPDLLADPDGLEGPAGPAGVPAHFSVVLPGSRAGRSSDLCLLQAGDDVVLRSRSARRVLRALCARLSDLAEPAPEHLVRSAGLAVVSGGRAVLLPPSARDLQRLQPLLAAAGVRMSDEPGALVDARSAALVIPAPTVRLPEATLGELPPDATWRGELPPAPPGRYRIAAWAYPGLPGLPGSAAVQVAGLLGGVDGDLDDLPTVVPALSELVSQTVCSAVEAGSADTVAEFVDSALSAAGSSG